MTEELKEEAMLPEELIKHEAQLLQEAQRLRNVYHKFGSVN